MNIHYVVYSDEELVACLQAGRDTAESAFTELYQRYSPRIYEYCLRIVGHEEIAQDIFQEVFVRFFHAASAEKTVQNVPGWLITVARNLCLTHKRLRKDFVPVEEHLLQEISPAYEYESSELMRLIIMALDLLEPAYKEVFILREFDGFTYSEIAKMLSMHEGTVKTQVFRAKQKIQTILQPYLHDVQRHA